MSDPYFGLIVIPAGPNARDRAMREAIQTYGLDVELCQVGWDPQTDELLFAVDETENE